MQQDDDELVSNFNTTEALDNQVIDKKAHHEYLMKIEREFNGKDGILEIVLGILVVLFCLYAISRSIPIEVSSYITIGLCFGFVVLSLTLDRFQNGYILKKYPHLTKKDLRMMTSYLDQIVVIPSLMAAIILPGVFKMLNVILPHYLLRHMFHFLMLGGFGATLICYFAVRYESKRFWLWYCFAQFISLSLLLYPDNWIKFYIKMGLLGIAMLIAGIIANIIFIKQFNSNKI